VPLLYGAVRISTAPDYASRLMHVPDVQLRLVQPSIPQSLKWDPRFARETVMTYLDLTRLENDPKPTHVIWPEAALPFRLNESPELVSDIARFAPLQRLPMNSRAGCLTQSWLAAPIGYPRWSRIIGGQARRNPPARFHY